MRVEIGHRDEGNRHLIDVVLELSEIEKRIINIRRLHQTVLDLSPGFLASSVSAVPGWVGVVLLAIMPFFFLAGCVGACTASTIAHSNPTPWAFIVFFAIGLFAWGLYVKIRSRQLTQQLTILDLLTSPRFAIFVPDPAEMRQVEYVFKQRVIVLKQILDEASETPTEVIEL